MCNEPLSPDVVLEVDQLLKFAVAADFQPAVITYAMLLMNNPKSFDELESLLRKSIEKYHNPEAYSALGTHFINNKDKNDGMKLIEEAFKLGSHNASYILGKIYSPFCDLDGGVKKDGKIALEYLKQNTMAQAVYEIAKLYYRGCDGVEQNMSNALILYDRVKKELDYLPSLEEATKLPPPKKNHTFIIFIISILILILSLIAFRYYH